MVTTKHWIAEKLKIRPEEIDLLIAKDYAGYFAIPNAEKEKLADCVLYHSSKGRIIFGPDSISCDSLEIRDCGYESHAFKEWSKKQLKPAKED